MQKTQQDKKRLEMAGCMDGMKMRNMHFLSYRKIVSKFLVSRNLHQIVFYDAP